MCFTSHRSLWAEEACCDDWRVSLGRSETLEFVTGQIKQLTALLSEGIDVFSHF